MPTASAAIAAGACRDDGSGSSPHGVDDLGVVDALQVDGGDPEVRVAKLPLNHHERDALTSHLDGVRVAQLVRRKAATHSGPGRDNSHLCAGGSRRPRPTTGSSMDDTEQRSDRQLPSELEPRRELIPRPVVHPDFASPAALAAAHQDRAAFTVEVALGWGERLADPHSRPPQHNHQPAQANAFRASPGRAHDGDDLLHAWRIGRITQALVPRRTPTVITRQSRRRPATTSSIQQHRLHDSSSSNSQTASVLSSKPPARQRPPHGKR